MDYETILETEFDNDLGTTTIRSFLKTLLATLISEGESFSGKRPFGNSDWEYQLANALVNCGAITGTLDEDGYADDFEWEDYHVIMSDLVEAL